jgi:hypothetical protein
MRQGLQILSETSGTSGEAQNLLQLFKWFWVLEQYAIRLLILLISSGHGCIFAV